MAIGLSYGLTTLKTVVIFILVDTEAHNCTVYQGFR